MNSKSLAGNVLLAVLLGLSIGCGINNPEPAPGTILGSGLIEVPSYESRDYSFSTGGESYGYIEFSYEKYSTWEKVEISAPYGIQFGTGNTAPATGYGLFPLDVKLSSSYFFMPDSTHYGYLEIISRSTNSSATIGFDWIIQTEPGNREFY
jgi:hypothetical protein